MRGLFSCIAVCTSRRCAEGGVGDAIKGAGDFAFASYGISTGTRGRFGDFFQIAVIACESGEICGVGAAFFDVVDFHGGADGGKIRLDLGDLRFVSHADEVWNGDGGEDADDGDDDDELSKQESFAFLERFLFLLHKMVTSFAEMTERSVGAFGAVLISIMR